MHRAKGDRFVRANELPVRQCICLHPGSISHFKMRYEHVLKTEKICRTFFSIRSLSNIAVIGNFDFNNFFNVFRF